MKSLFCILFFLVLSFQNNFAQTATVPTGNGTSDNPYLIASLENLYWISFKTNNEWNNLEGMYFEQTANIDASSTLTWFNGNGWLPIGNHIIYFEGNYDGQGYTISNLHINRPASPRIGLFGLTLNATLQNICLDGADLVGENGVGALVGSGYSTSITNCYATGTVSGVYDIGCLVGYSSECTISNCYAIGTVSGDYRIGGLIATLAYSPITNCYAICNVSGSNGLGGIAALISGSTMNSCFSSGEISGGTVVGGLAGVSFSNALITNCYSTCSVSGTIDIGGLLGYADYTVIRYCFATGLVVGTNNYGGLVGADNSSFVQNCFYDSETTLATNNGMGTPKTTLEMQTQSTFTDAGWDFITEITNGINDYWETNLVYNNMYPFLSWQTPPEINIKGNNLNIASGDNTTSSDDYTLIGGVLYNSGLTTTKSFTIENNGELPLSLTALSPYISISGDDAADFSIVQIPASTISVKGSTTFQIGFTPSTLGTKNATLSINSNDPDEGTYTYAIQGICDEYPTTQARNITFSNITRTSMTVRWARGSGDAGCVLLARQQYRIPNSPLTDGTIYDVNNSFTLAANVESTKVLYDGIENSAVISDLTRYQLVYFKVCEYNNSIFPFYLQTDASNNPRSRWTLRRDDLLEEDLTIDVDYPYPNPVSYSITTKLDIFEEGNVQALLFDNSGRQIAELYNNSLSFGIHELVFDLSKIEAGNYQLIITKGSEALAYPISVVR